MAVNTDDARANVMNLGNPLQMLVVMLLCDILDELRENAKNRQRALDAWFIQKTAENADATQQRRERRNSGS